jgi:hypothetical protein
MLKRIKKDIDILKTEPQLIDFTPLGKRTPQNVASGIVHVAPEVPFVLDGVAYDPKDINRFDGQALVFMPILAADGKIWLHLFQEEIGEVIASYFQVRQLSALLNPSDFNTPGFPPPPPPGTPPGLGQTPPPSIPPMAGCGAWPLPPCGQSQQPSPGSGGGGSGSGSMPEPPGPFTWGQVQMFDGGYYTGNWFWLAKGYMWKDLRKVSRGGFFGGNWNDEIFSLSSTNTSCIYCEHINLEGSKLFLGPNKPIGNLVPLGWHNRISSVWNFDS